MNDIQRERIYKNLNVKETEDLLDIWQNGDVDEWEEIVFEIVKEILLARLGYLPPQFSEVPISQILDRVDEYIEKNELEQAISECKIAIQLNPDFPLSYNYLGEVYDEMEQLENAIINYQKAIRLDPEFKDAWDNMLRVEFELQKEFDESLAKQHLNQALEYAHDDEPEKALAECEVAKPLMPSIAIAYNYLGLILQTSNHLELAIDSYLKAIELNPRFYAARKNLADARISWEEKQYQRFSDLGSIEGQEIAVEFDETQIQESEESIPQWLYIDQNAFLLPGWAGHRTRQGRSGYDPLETDFEYAHMQGTMIRLILTRRFRTRNPIYLAFMVFVGMLYFLGSISPLAYGNLYGVIIVIFYSPYLIMAVMLLVNVYLSLQLKEYENEDNGSAFF